MRRKLDLLSEKRVRLSRSDSLDELRADIVRASYITGDFVLADGVRSAYYFDKYLFETRPAVLRRLSRFLADLVPRETDRLAAPALGAVALGTAVSLELGLPLVIVRLDENARNERPLEGEVYPGEDITLVEDVVVTGSRALRAISRLGDSGARVKNVVSVVDRGEGAPERLSEISVGYAHLFTPEDLGID